jgi:WD repeat and SOF domain-containing protein 1
MSCIQAESDVFASTGGDRSIALYDLRSARPIRKLVMQTRTNSVAWNPMEAFNFTAASEDCNLYTYDMRKLQSATCVHKVGTAAWGSEFNDMEVDHRRPAS